MAESSLFTLPSHRHTTPEEHGSMCDAIFSLHFESFIPILLKCNQLVCFSCLKSIFELQLNFGSRNHCPVSHNDDIHTMSDPDTKRSLRSRFVWDSEPKEMQVVSLPAQVKQKSAILYTQAVLALDGSDVRASLCATLPVNGVPNMPFPAEPLLALTFSLDRNPYSSASFTNSLQPKADMSTFFDFKMYEAESTATEQGTQQAETVATEGDSQISVAKTLSLTLERAEFSTQSIHKHALQDHMSFKAPSSAEINDVVFRALSEIQKMGFDHR